MQGLIIENISNLYKIKTNNKIYNATARGKFKQNDITPLVGDNVEIEVLNEQDNTAVINDILPRVNLIKRPKVANITQIILVVSTKNPKPDLLILDKQLAYFEYLKIKPIIVINKIDLDNAYKQIKDIYTKVGYKVILTNAKQQEGITELKNVLNGHISAISGNSGVGKSTIINALFGTDITLEGEVSKKNKKGKNTTTAIKLYELDQNTFIADTPGFANFDITEIESKSLDSYFIEFRPYIKNCEFIGCTHIKENNCGIKNALEEGKILQTRYNNFCNNISVEYLPVSVPCLNFFIC